MCLVVIAHRCHDDFPLVVAANRDEFHARPSSDADWWPGQQGILAGRDMQAGGTWLGVTRSGRFATITNYRDADAAVAGARSRGQLVADFLAGSSSPGDYLAGVEPGDFAGFNLLLAAGTSLAYLSNRGAGLRELPPGIYGLSNATLDTPWEKVARSKAQLGRLLANGRITDPDLLDLLADREKGPPEEARGDRLPFETAHAITAPFIVTPEYGTRCSTVLRTEASGHWHFLEKRFDAAGNTTGESQFSFRVDGE